MTKLRTRDWAGADYYRILGVTRDARPEVVDDAYRACAKEWHPDRRPGDRDAEERFKEITVAYGVLRDPATRAAYADYRRRIDEGRLYDVPRPAPVAPAASRPEPVRRRRAPMPAWARQAVAGLLLVAALAVGLLAGVADFEGPTAGDTPLAVRITLAIMAAKLLAGSVVAFWYPQLRERFRPARIADT